MKRAAQPAAKTKKETRAEKRKLIEAISGRSAFAHLAHSTAGDGRATASAILAAGELARAGGPKLPKPTGLAAQILAAGAKARS
ncbi:hypothetical protein [Bradyrhizobium viridifuturi]|uniref:hypothetical protein n=1 Tax=Bradyrhizobium viridifuturi TaxID=1654716 RepID=UPI00067EE246|nr:hypothetical protein [Bradyrhizobium viridifuturi]